MIKKLIDKIFKPKNFSTSNFTRSSIDYKNREIVKQKWQEIQSLMMQGRPSNFKQAVLEADKLLNFVLEKMNYQGSLGEKLKSSKERFSREVYNDLWEAHKIRNRLAHEIGYEILHYEAKEAIMKFEKGLKDLGVL